MRESGGSPRAGRPTTGGDAMIVFSDLHMKEATESVAWEALAAVEAAALADEDHHVIFCGDFWHLRYQVNVRLLDQVHEMLTRWIAAGLEVDLIPGNHDQVTIGGVNALSVLARPGVEIWTEPGVQQVADRRWHGFVPYRKDLGEQQDALDAVRAELQVRGARFPVIFGHFAVRGAMMNSGIQDRAGLEVQVPLGELLVLGHYHMPHWVGDRVVYVGSTHQHSFGEVDNNPGIGKLTWSESDGWGWTHWDLNVGARHFIVSWDAEADPPALPAGYRPDVDKLRLDVAAPVNRLVDPDLVRRVRAAGFESAQVNVIPRAVEREQRFEVAPSERLEDAAVRFARGRLSDLQIPKMERAALEALRKWSNAT